MCRGAGVKGKESFFVPLRSSTSHDVVNTELVMRVRRKVVPKILLNFALQNAQKQNLPLPNKPLGKYLNMYQTVSIM